MIYTEQLKELEIEMAECLEELFSAAYANQQYPTDLLLIINHGYFDRNIKEQFPNTTGHMLGAGINMEEFAEKTQYEFYDAYRKNYLDIYKQLFPELNSRQDFVNKVKEDGEAKHFEEMSVQLELIVYQKIWESYLFLKRQCQLIDLANKKPYSWDFRQAKPSNLITNRLVALLLFEWVIFEEFLTFN